LNPITALAFLELDRLYLLAGEGCYLSIYDHETKVLIYSGRVFEEQTIHGIVCSTRATQPDSDRHGDLLIWGGRSTSTLFVEATDGRTLLLVQSPSTEHQVDDWILDGCFGGEDNTTAYFVNAHNEAYNFTAANGAHRIACGPTSILYSAHIVWSEDGSLLVAAGTVFGEVVLWSCDIADSKDTATVQLHRIFSGHEGSVFGVRISETVEQYPWRRLLASCSDDRTIRVWDISDVADGRDSTEDTVMHKEIESSSESLASIMGHASRIWGVSFLAYDPTGWEIFSRGEDGTAQTWSLMFGHDLKHDRDGVSIRRCTLRHKETRRYHLGKNLWAVAVYSGRPYSPIIATGGANGRVISYKNTDGFLLQVTMGDVRGLAQPRDTRTRGLTLRKSIITSLKGPWKLFRRLRSANADFPSGFLEGGASFDQRTPSDEVYDIEYLYSEWGDFVPDQGFAMKATRQYVYRYQELSDEISVWFVKPEDKSTVDYLYHVLHFDELGAENLKRAETYNGRDATASGHHLCVEDSYGAKYSFCLKDSIISEWWAEFAVVGPSKDYLAKATYVRDSHFSQSESMGSISEGLGISNAAGEILFDLEPSKPDNFKTYVWINEHDVLASTEQGFLLVGALIIGRITNLEGGSNITQSISWKVICHRTSLMSSSIATSILAMGIVLLSGNDGSIYLYQHAYRRLDELHKYPRKLAYMRAQGLQRPWNNINALRGEDSQEDEGFWESSQTPTPSLIGVVTTCLGLPEVNVLLFRPGEVHSQPTSRQLTLRLTNDFIVTACSFVESAGLLLIGSRKGNLAMYDLELCARCKFAMSPMLKSHQHEDAITTIEPLATPNEDQVKSVIYLTTGRDGTCAVHQIIFDRAGATESAEEAVTQTIHRFTPPFGPNIEGAWLNPLNDDIYLWGFRSTQFVVWNESQKLETMTVECGGAHRHWAFIPQQDGQGGGNLIFTKASVCYIRSQERSSHQVFRSGGHGREIKAMCVSAPIEEGDTFEDTLIATGAEDTAIRVFDNKLRCISVLCDHTTGIQQLRWSPKSPVQQEASIKVAKRLFSAAGCEEFFAWRVTPMPSFGGIGIVREGVCPRVSEDGDLRIMDFTIRAQTRLSELPEYFYTWYVLCMLYSDSSVRMFRYDPAETGKFTLLASGLYDTFCLTQAVLTDFRGRSDSVMCTASTDGYLTFWPLQRALFCRLTLPVMSLQWDKRVKVHQNSIKSLDAIHPSPSDYFIATAGDDGAISLTRLAYADSGELTHSTLLLPRAHASAVRSVGLIRGSVNDNEIHFSLASVGNDQRLKLWKVHIHMEKSGVQGITIEERASVYTSIADASSLSIYRDAESQPWLYVAGIGIERWKMTDVLGS